MSHHATVPSADTSKVDATESMQVYDRILMARDRIKLEYPSLKSLADARAVLAFILRQLRLILVDAAELKEVYDRILTARDRIKFEYPSLKSLADARTVLAVIQDQLHLILIDADIVPNDLAP